MALWFGFKQYAVDLSVKVRRRLALSPVDRLDVRRLAALYDVPIVPFDQLPTATEAVRYFTETHRTRLSGLVVPVNGQQVILFNPADGDERFVSTITHEVSHCLLDHQSELRLTGEETCLSGHPDQEDEAAWLGGELLVPRDAARCMVFRGIGEDAAAAMYGVSIEMARWRMNICGGRQMQRHFG